jgi:hypothetical protein
VTGSTIVSNAPPAVRQYLARCGEAEELVAWWQQENPRDPHEALWVITCHRASRRFDVSSFPVVVSHWIHQVSGSSYDPDGMRRQLVAGLWSAPDTARIAVSACLASLAPAG